MNAFQTPRRKLTVWILSLSWLAFQPVATWVYYAANSRRGTYPPEADTIIVGQMQATVGWVVTLPIFLTFFWFCFRKYPGRVSFLAFNPERIAWSSIWSTLLIGIGVIEFWSLISNILGLYPLDVLSNSLALYLLLCCRSSLMFSSVGVPSQAAVIQHA